MSDAAERAALHHAFARGYLTATQVDAARTQSAPGAALLPQLASQLSAAQRSELLVIYNQALGAAGSGSNVVTIPPTASSRSGSPPAPAGPPAAIDRYTIVRELARGGMGVVYIGQDEALDRQVAIKQMLRSADRVEIERFQREAKAVAKLKHPNIVGVLDFGEAEGGHYMVMELVEGESLQGKITREGPNRR
jgi:hypothetical protein